MVLSSVQLQKVSVTLWSPWLQCSGVASPKFGGAKNFVEGQNVCFSTNNTILFEKMPLKAQNDCIF